MKDWDWAISWSLIVTGLMIIIYSIVFQQPVEPAQCATSSILSILSNSLLTFGVGLALMMIGFVKLFADRYNKK